MQLRRRIRTSYLSIMLLSLLMSLISACAPATGPAAGGAAAGEADSSAPIQIEFLSTAANVPPPDDIIVQALNERVGIDFEANILASEDDYLNQLNVRLAGGNYPDIFRVNRQRLLEFADKGLLLDITPYQAELTDAIAFAGDENLAKGMVDGKLYGIPTRAGLTPLYFTYWIRQDWLDTLGLEVPTTIEELFEVARAFTEDDPDGNGSNDTFGFTGVGLTGGDNAFTPIYGAFGVGNPRNLYVEDGKLVSAYFDPGMPDALAFINEMIEAGVVDPDLVATTGAQHQDKAFQGKAGIVYIDWARMTKTEFVEQYKTVNPDAEWTQVGPPEGPAGASGANREIGSVGFVALSPDLADEPEKLQKVIDLLNYVGSEEGTNLVQYGIEGKHFNIENGEVVPTPLLDEEGAYFFVYQLFGRDDISYLNTKFAAQKEYFEFGFAQPHKETLNGFVELPEGYNPADAERFAEEELVKFAYGDRPLEEYDAFLETLNTTFNYSVYMDAANEQLTTLGYVTE
jgi:putative aldouronate transport system substrate-binding protein